MNLEDALQTFVLESRELLDDMEMALLAIMQAEEKGEMVNAIFRAAHTIKGSSGLFGLDHVVAFTHVVENLLDQLRANNLEISEALVALLLSCCDQIRAMVERIAAGHKAPDPDLQRRGEPLLEQLRIFLETPLAREPGTAAIKTQDDATLERIQGEGVHSEHWHISLRFGPEVLRNGLDPLSFIRYLETIGHIAAIETHADALPLLAQMDPELCYLGFEIALHSTASKTTIENVFEFVQDECQLRILPPHSLITEYVHLLQQQQGDVRRLGEMLLSCGTLTAQELDAALNAQSDSPSKPIGTILVEQGLVQAAVVEAALTKQKQVKDIGAAESRSIRVDADKLDQLINLVGELIIAGASVNLIAHKARIVELQESTSKLSMLVEEVRDSALQLRMVKIGPTFSRFQRVVHDVSRELGKNVALTIHGEDTELDKTVVEKIGDPLMHLVRNALDHGIESAELRAQRGKPAQGTLVLNAFHDSGSIVITVQDDGGGLNRERILAKAIERGLVESGQHLSDPEVYGMIFEPGFSTAEKITNLSGRGVGLDVVKRNITALRGTVGLTSMEGDGTTVTVRLPLTLAIIDGFLVEVGKSVFAIPLDMIEECIAYTAEPGHNYTNLRGQVLPFIRLRELFALKGEAARSENIVVLRHGNQKAGLVVDKLLGEFQTVIKPLGEMFSQVKCISGSTILGSGEVALIIDVPAVVNQCVAAARNGNPVVSARMPGLSV
jgi:two-component system chemotaxis sensor kinase CheA